LEGGPPNFPQGFSCPVVLRKQAQRASTLSSTGLSPTLVGLSRTFRLELRFVSRRSVLTRNRLTPVTPAGQRIRTLTSRRFRLFPFRSPLLGESRLISLPLGTEMFHFPRFASSPYGFRTGCSVFNGTGFPIRVSPDHCLLAAPRGLSQLATPFFTS
jgi:hypothetical protein